MTMNHTDIALATSKREAGLTAPECDSADSSTGCLIGPLDPGCYEITADQTVYFLRGASTMTPATDVLADESTPALSVPLRGGEVKQLVVEPSHVGTKDCIGCLTAAGTSNIVVTKTGDFVRKPDAI